MRPLNFSMPLGPVMSRFMGLNAVRLTRPIRMSFKRLQHTIKQSSPPPPPPPPKKPTGIKALMKEYGYSALGVYLGISALDLPLFYLLVHSMGKDEIEQYENTVKQWFGYGVSEEELKKKQAIDRVEEEAEKEGSPEPEQTSILGTILAQFSWTEFAIAYTIHKSFIFIRLPITAAITPTVVKVLRNWGFKIGQQSLSTSANIAKGHIKDIRASSTNFGVRPDRKKKWFDFFF